MKLKVTVDEATGDVKLLTDSGEMIENVQSISWSIDNNSKGESECIIHLKDVFLELVFSDLELHAEGAEGEK